MLGLPYCASVIAILGCHEMGHYLACRRYGIDSTPPFFLPSPPGMLFGTFGAFIRIREPFTDRRTLFDVGVAGPLAGFVVAVPVLIYGVFHATWMPEIDEPGATYFGDCLATRLLTAWLVPEPPAPQGYVLGFGSVAIAGWLGLYATALNLLPVGQLDGGHIAYSISRGFHKAMTKVSLGAFIVMGLLYHETWLFWASLLIFFNPRHPALLDESSRLNPGRLAVAALAGVILILALIPIPLRISG